MLELSDKRLSARRERLLKEGNPGLGLGDRQT
jgi:hypothetical protein